jgi:hypothetical protein
LRLSLEHCIPIPLCLQTTAKVLEDTRALYSKDSKSLSTPAGKYAAHHLLLLAGIQRSNAGILLADTETSEGRMIAEIQDSLANSDKPLMRAFIELCKALNVGGRKKDQAQSAFAKALHDVIREAATARIESSNAASPSNAAPALSALAPADVESSNAASPSNAAPALSALAPAGVESSNAASPSNAAPALSALERVCSTSKKRKAEAMVG